MRGLVLAVILASLGGACALNGSKRVAGKTPTGADDPAFQAYVARVREASLGARPAPRSELQALERFAPALLEARALVESNPSADNHRALAEAYAAAGVLDAASEHFMAAIARQPEDSRSLDGLARVWRDSGFPETGLGYARQAVRVAPRAPGVHNTLGTILLKLGLAADARRAFETALALDPRAMYALNNLCWVDLLDGHAATAVQGCARALLGAPGLRAARNNLGLALVAAGDLETGARAFASAGSAATARYNMGVALLATGRFPDAAAAFDDAQDLSPTPTDAAARATMARALAARNAPATAR